MDTNTYILTKGQDQLNESLRELKDSQVGIKIRLNHLADGQSRLNTRLDNIARRFDERFQKLEDHLDNQNYGIYNILELLKSSLPEPWTHQFKDSSTKGEKGREETHRDQGQSSHREGKEPIHEDEDKDQDQDHEPYQPELVRTPPGLNDDDMEVTLYNDDGRAESILWWQIW